MLHCANLAIVQRTLRELSWSARSRAVLPTDGRGATEPTEPAQLGVDTVHDTIATIESSTMRLTERTREPRCRICRAPVRRTFVDLGMSPLCESFLTRSQL